MTHEDALLLIRAVNEIGVILWFIFAALVAKWLI